MEEDRKKINQAYNIIHESENKQQDIDRSFVELSKELNIYDQFLDSIIESYSLNDYYFETEIGSGSLKQTTKELLSKNKNRIDDKFDESPLQQAERFSSEKMNESHQQPGKTEHQKSLEIELWDYRRSSTRNEPIEGLENLDQLVAETFRSQYFDQATWTHSLSQENINQVNQSMISHAQCEKEIRKQKNILNDSPTLALNGTNQDFSISRVDLEEKQPDRPEYVPLPNKEDASRHSSPPAFDPSEYLDARNSQITKQDPSDKNEKLASEKTGLESQEFLEINNVTSWLNQRREREDSRSVKDQPGEINSRELGGNSEIQPESLIQKREYGRRTLSEIKENVVSLEKIDEYAGRGLNASNALGYAENLLQLTLDGPGSHLAQRLRKGLIQDMDKAFQNNDWDLSAYRTSKETGKTFAERFREKHKLEQEMEGPNRELDKNQDSLTDR